MSKQIKSIELNTKFGIITIVVLLLCLPVIIDLVWGGESVPFRYFSADAFYYFTVARNFAQLGVLTFDQVYPTNGFHPLWQLLMGILYKISLLVYLSETTYLTIVLGLGMVLVAAGVALTGLAFVNIRNRLPVSFILVPVGIYALLILPIWVYFLDVKGYQNQLEGPTPLYGTMWSFMNGMESGLAIFFFGLLFFSFTIFIRMTLLQAAILGLVASLLVLSRLDHIFIVGGLLLYFCAQVITSKTKPSLQKLLIFTGFLMIPIIIYMLINYSYAHAFMPVSASAKSTFPIPTIENFYYLIFVLRYPFNDHRWLDNFYRITQIVIPGLVAIVAIQRWLTQFLPNKAQKLDRVDDFLALTGVGVLGLAFYNFFFVQFYGTGHWYFPVSILYVSLVFINVVDKSSKGAIIHTWKVIFYSLICLLVFVIMHRRARYHDNYIRFYFDEAKQIQTYYQDNPPQILEYDDGIIAFSLRYPTMSGFGFALDQEAFVEAQNDRLVDIAFERGFDRITSLSYKNFSQTNAKDPEMVWFLPVDRYKFIVEYASPDHFFGIIQIDKEIGASDDPQN